MFPQSTPRTQLQPVSAPITLISTPSGMSEKAILEVRKACRAGGFPGRTCRKALEWGMVVVRSRVSTRRPQSMVPRFHAASDHVTAPNVDLFMIRNAADLNSATRVAVPLKAFAISTATTQSYHCLCYCNHLPERKLACSSQLDNSSLGHLTSPHKGPVTEVSRS